MCCKTAQVEVQIKLWRLFEEKYETDPNASLQLLSMLFHTNFNLKCAGLLQKTFVNESTRREWNSVSFESFDRYGFMFCFSANQINLSKQFPEIPKAILFFMRFKFFCLSQKVLFEVSKSLSHSPSCDMVSLWQRVCVCVCAHECVCVWHFADTCIHRIIPFQQLFDDFVLSLSPHDQSPFQFPHFLHHQVQW